jgi:methylmalonyl-CoA mutase cobalamin-binding subunit
MIHKAFAGQIRRQLDTWQAQGLPSREGYLQVAETLLAWRCREGCSGLWPRPPLMVTATLDDAMGHGLAVIEAVAEAAGLRVISLGLLQTVTAVAEVCRRHQPDLLGLTVLQLDTETELTELCQALEPTIRVVAGGPVFTADPELARRAGLSAAIRNAAAFLDYLLSFTPTSGEDGNREA